MAKYSKLINSSNFSITPDLNVIIIKREVFDSNIDAGKIDKFIEEHYPNFISRDENKVNGVSVTKDEIMITLASPLTDTQKDAIISALENASL